MTVEVLPQNEPVVRESETTLYQLNGNQTIWGNDAQEHWRRLGREATFAAVGDHLLITDPQAVDEVLHDPVRFSSNPDAIYLGSKSGLIPLQVDPPEHVRYRRMLDPLFTPRRMAALEEGVAALTNRCIDGFIGRGSCDLSVELAVPVPCGTFLQLMGLPLEGLAEFIVKKDDMIRPEGTTQEEVDEKRAAAGRWIAEMYTRELEERRRAPRDDILGHLVELEGRGELSPDESLCISHLLLLAGLDTVTDSLECSFALLAQHPAAQRQLAEDPSLVPSATEELLRFMNPVPTIVRVAMVDTELDGCPIKKGTRMSVLLASTNLDESRYESPAEIDLRRPVNKHIGFGLGVHRCLGSHLARLELRVALREWHRRIPEYRLPEGHVIRWSPALREILHLPLEFPPGEPRS